MYIEFVVPKGYKGALYIKPLAYKMVKNQDELLFKRGLCYNVIEAEEKDGCFYIKEYAPWDNEEHIKMILDGEEKAKVGSSMWSNPWMP